MTAGHPETVHPKHQHGWHCFKESGGYTAMFENDGRTLAEKIETLYHTAYRTGYRNGRSDALDTLIHTQGHPGESM